MSPGRGGLRFRTASTRMVPLRYVVAVAPRFAVAPRPVLADLEVFEGQRVDVFGGDRHRTRPPRAADRAGDQRAHGHRVADDHRLDRPGVDVAHPAGYPESLGAALHPNPVTDPGHAPADGQPQGEPLGTLVVGR